MTWLLAFLGICEIKAFAMAVPINASESVSTLSPVNFLNTIENTFYPFMYEVPLILSYIVGNETLRKNLSSISIGNPYQDLATVKKGDTEYWPIQYCGLHFLNKKEGYILRDNPFTNEEITERCTWAFVGDNFCTPEIECPQFRGRGGNCRTNYLQISDGGSSFMHHFCDDETYHPKNTMYTSKEGVLDVVFRHSHPSKRPAFECWVKCVNYPVNFTATGSNAVGSKIPLNVTIHEGITAVENTIPPPLTNPNCKCGISNDGGNRSTRIVGGRVTLPNQYPWTIGIVNRIGKLPYCGASLISAEYVLTAAHCVEDEELEDIIVVLNEHDYYNATETKGGPLYRRVLEVISYSYYLESTFSGDVALLRLDRAVPVTTPQYTHVCLPSPDLSSLNGKEVLGTGWGTTSGGVGASKSPKLQEVSLVVFPNEACNDYHNHSPPDPPQIENNMLCAGYSEGGRDTCAGDSGGPLTIKDGGRFTQIGVTSWGFGCALRLNPGVFSRVSAFMNWIRMHTVDGSFCV